MFKFIQAALFATAMTASFSMAPALAELSPYGTWSMGKVTVRVSNCGGSLCGTIVGLKEPISKIDGKPKVDRENPNAAKRKRPLIGLSILGGMKPAGANKWKGTIYNPDDGKTYSATVKFNGSKLVVQGCVASVFCKSNTFVRLN